MRGIMMDRPLLVSHQIEYAGRYFADRPVVSRTSEGGVHHTSWGEVAVRARRLAEALTDGGVAPGDRVATLAWNDHRHLEAYFGVSGTGAVLHTINPRLHPAQLAYVVNHAEDRWMLVDPTFLPLVEALREQLGTVERWVVLADRDALPETSLPGAVSYEELLEGRPGTFEWPEFDENDACSLCYTSGTTGHPKGVLYSHRSTVLHSYGAAMPGGMSMGPDHVFLPVVPMFHANAWGTPYSCAITGTGLVLPGPALDGRSLTALMNEAEVTAAAGVPTVWLGLARYWRESGERVPTLQEISFGGSAPPAALVRVFEEEFEVAVLHGWGMTEMSPVGSLNALTAEERARPVEERVALLVRQGRPLYNVETRVVDGDGNEVPADGESVGELLVRGPWVCSGYFREEASPVHRDDGWMATGDIVVVHPDGRLQITDRAKDLIKSGGEWISSIDLENAAMGHPGVGHAAVIGVPDEKWGERPLLVVVPESDPPPDPDDIRSFLGDRVASWWIPEQVVFREELPLGGTGKVQKTRLREWWTARGASPELPADSGAEQPGS